MVSKALGSQQQPSRPPATISDPRRAASTLWRGPALMLVIRIPLILGGLGLVTVVLHALGGPAGSSWSAAWSAAQNYTYVIVSLCADLGGVVVLRWFLRREGLRLRDLVNFDRARLGRDVLMGCGVFVLLAAVFWVTPVLASFVTNDAQAYPAGATAPPRWVLLYTTVVLPFTLAPAEELIYRAYALPRLTAVIGRAWLAIVLIAIAFSAEHLVIPPVGDAGTLIARFLTLAVVGLTLQIVYLRLGRLVPLIIAHWLIVALFLGGLPLLLSFQP